nr:rhomboid family intramembrane serine protease [Corynebacterium uterequi]
MTPGYPGSATPPAAPSSRVRSGGGLKGAVTYAVGFVVAIWSVFLVNLLVFGGDLVFFGIHPLDTASWWGIFAAPFLHANLEHVLSNTVPGAVFAFLIGFSGRRVFWEVTLITVVAAGAGTWLFGGVATNHIGASGVVYGWLAYLLIRGVFNRHLGQVVVGVVLGIAYSGLIFGLLPGVPGVSWQGHLFGALGGLGAGMLITSDDPPALVERRQLKKARKALSSGRR